MNPFRVCFVLTIPFAVRGYLRDHIVRLCSIGFEVMVLVNLEGSEVALDLPPAVRVLHLPIQRKIRPGSDLSVLFTLLRYFRQERFLIVHSMMPKAGLLAMLAARLAGVPHRVHTFTGQVWATQIGLRRFILKSVDRFVAACATHLLTDSRSQMDFLVAENVVTAKRIGVLANGSICGVDTRRFRADEAIRREVRSRHGYSSEELVLLFVGRMARDKGIVDLVTAFSRLRDAGHRLVLLLVGPDEEGLVKGLGAVSGMQHVGFSAQVETYFAAADIFCLPSYREGFGSVLIEAGAAGLPVVASRIYGITDAVVEGQTGLLFPPGDVDALTAALLGLVGDSDVRRRMGEAGRIRAGTKFSTDVVTQAMANFYLGLAGRNAG